jgi:hypothetical protein
MPTMSSSSVLNKCPAKKEGMKRKRFFTHCLTLISRITDFMYDTKPFMKYPMLQVEVLGVVDMSSIGSTGGRGVVVVRPVTGGELVVVVVDSIPQLPNIF